MSTLNPFSLENLAGAAVRPLLLRADTPAVIAAHADAIFAQTEADDYAPAGDWFDIGATSGGCQVSRNLTTSGYTIEQSQTTLLEEPDQLTYTVQIPFAEVYPQTLEILSEGETSAVAAAAKRSAADVVKFGNIPELSHYALALVVRRKKAQGVVVEGAGGPKRGRFLVFVGYDCTIQAENVQSTFQKGQLASMPITFKLYPIDTQPEGEEHGYWLDEHAGTIALT